LEQVFAYRFIFAMVLKIKFSIIQKDIKIRAKTYPLFRPQGRLEETLPVVAGPPLALPGPAAIG
jgi:hypothetical protein